MATVRRRRWLSPVGLSSTNRQRLTADCATIRSSKEVRGERIGSGLIMWSGGGLMFVVFILRLVFLSYCVDVLFPNVCHVCASTVAGQEDCWLLTETLIQTASLQLKVCLNVQCLALHSFTDLHPGKLHHSLISSRESSCRL